MWYTNLLFKYAANRDKTLADLFLKYAAAQGKIVPGKVCPYCHSQLIERQGQYGPFLGCSSYPKCQYLYNVDKSYNKHSLSWLCFSI